jgi:phage terminase small subunit
MRHDLTDKQKAFVQEYLLDLNAKQAAIRAGYTKNRAEQAGYELLTFPDVQEAVQKAKAERAERMKIDQDYVLELIQEAIKASRAAEDRASFLKAADMLGRHVGLYAQDNKQRSPLADLPRDVLKMLEVKLSGLSHS